MEIKRINFKCTALNEKSEVVHTLIIKTYRYAVAENSFWGNCVKADIKFTHYLIEPEENVLRKR